MTITDQTSSSQANGNQTSGNRTGTTADGAAATANTPPIRHTRDGHRRRSTLGWAGVGVGLAATVALAVAVLRPDPARHVDLNARSAAEHGSVTAIDHRDLSSVAQGDSNARTVAEHGSVAAIDHRDSVSVAGSAPTAKVLAEWYPAGEELKTIVVTDGSLAAPAVRHVPVGDGAAVHASWSHDGTRFTWEVLRADDTASVWIADADGSNPVERVVCQQAPCVEMSYPVFSPDDARLLATRFDRAADGTWGASHLVVVDLATDEQTVIASTADGSTSFYSSTWSPDGSHVAVARETYADETQGERTASEIVVYDTDPGTVDPPLSVTPAALFAGFPRWHPTDDRILFASWDLDAFHGAEPSQLYTVASDGSALTQITHVDHAAVSRRPGEASWTPDGRRIIASIGIVEGPWVTDVKIADIDPVTGAIDETSTSGAMPVLQPRPQPA